MQQHENMASRAAAIGTRSIWLLTLLLVAAAGSAAARHALQLPPIAQPPSGETHPGKIVWADLVTPDLKQAEQFYGPLLHWSFTAAPGDAHFAVASLAGRPIAGLVERATAGQQRQPAWLPFIAVRDVEAAQHRAVADGARLLAGPRDYPRRGQQAVLADPDGAVFAVLASSSGDPPDELADPGEWIWAALLVDHPQQEAQFYHSLFDYQLYDLSENDARSTASVAAAAERPQRVILASEDYARAGIYPLPQDGRHRRPHWLNFVRVQDTAAAVTQAVALGGRVLVEPRIDRHGGLIAVIADPAGAPLGLMEWPAAGTEGAPGEPQIPQRASDAESPSGAAPAGGTP